MFLQLCGDLQEKILSYCSWEDLVSLSVTNRSCHIAAASLLFKNVTISFTRIKKKQKIPDNVKFAQRVRVCGAPKGTSLAEKFCKTIGELKHLRTLILENIIVRGGTLKLLCELLPKLNELIMVTSSMCLSESICQVDANLCHLQKLPELNSLRCMFKDITDLGMSDHISKLTKLCKLDLHQCHQITDEGIAHLSSLKQLRELHLRCCRQVTGSTFHALHDLPWLSKINVSYSPISAHGFHSIAQMTGVNELIAFGCGCLGEQFLHITTMKHLRRLTIGDGRLLSTDDVDLYCENISSLTSLERFCVDAGWIRGDLLERIAGLPMLKELVLISGLIVERDLCYFGVDVHITRPGWQTFLESIDMDY